MAWLIEAIQEKEPITLRWETLVSITHVAFQEGRLPVKINWTKIAILSNVEGDFRGIVLVEVILKVCTFIMKNRLRYSIALHDALQGFRKGWGTGTATSEEKLVRQLAGIFHGPIFQVFLDLQKAYESLYR